MATVVSNVLPWPARVSLSNRGDLALLDAKGFLNRSCNLKKMRNWAGSVTLVVLHQVSFCVRTHLAADGLMGRPTMIG